MISKEPNFFETHAAIIQKRLSPEINEILNKATGMMNTDIQKKSERDTVSPRA